jgi:hypothetical protein
VLAAPRTPRRSPSRLRALAALPRSPSPLLLTVYRWVVQPRSPGA